MQERILSGLRSYALAKVATQLVSWTGTVLVVRAIDSEALGLFAIAIVVCSYAVLIFEGGFAEALVQRPPDSTAERQAIFTVLVLAGIALAGSLVLAARPIAWVLGEPGIAPLVALSALSLVMTSLAVLPYAELARSMHFSRLAQIDSMQALVSTALTVGMAHAGFGAWALMGGVLAGTAFRAIALNWAAPGSMRLTHKLGAVAHYLRFGGLVFADAVLWLAYTTADTLLLARWAGTASLGYYRLGQEVANLGLEKLSTIVNQVALPAYARLGDDRAGVARLSLETLRAHAVIGLPFFWGLAAVADVAVTVLFGERWGTAVFPLMAFAIVAPLRLLTSIESPAMTGTGRPEVLVRTKLMVAPGMIAAVALGAYSAGIAGAAWAWLMAYPLLQLVAFRVVLKAIELDYRQVLHVVRGALASSLLMVVVVCGCLAGTGVLEWPPVVRLVLAIMVGGVIYGAALRILDRESLDVTVRRLRRIAGLSPAT